MAGRLRKAVIALILIAGIGAALPLQSGLGERLTQPADPPTFLPGFEIDVRRGTLVLDGNAVSAAHETALARAAARYFPGMTIETRFRPLGMAPDWWPGATVALVSSLSVLHSGSARLTTDSLRIRGMADDKPLAARRLRALGEILPDSVNRQVDVTSYDADVAAAELCERRFASFEHEPVGFEESGVELLSSAYPVIDRVVVLADACRDAVISITGHTDASGSEAWNRRLSLERARAVAATLEGRGIDAARVRVIGAGSSRPIADNATRYGRSLNRRIEIRFSPAG